MENKSKKDRLKPAMSRKSFDKSLINPLLNGCSAGRKNEWERVIKLYKEIGGKFDGLRWEMKNISILKRNIILDLLFVLEAIYINDIRRKNRAYFSIYNFIIML